MQAFRQIQVIDEPIVAPHNVSICQAAMSRYARRMHTTGDERQAALLCLQLFIAQDLSEFSRRHSLYSGKKVVNIFANTKGGRT